MQDVNTFYDTSLNRQLQILEELADKAKEEIGEFYEDSDKWRALHNACYLMQQTIDEQDTDPDYQEDDD